MRLKHLKPPQELFTFLSQFPPVNFFTRIATLPPPPPLGTLHDNQIFLCLADVSGAMPDSYSPTYVEAAWYAWWEKEVIYHRIMKICFVENEQKIVFTHRVLLLGRLLLVNYVKSNHCILTVLRTVSRGLGWGPVLF